MATGKRRNGLALVLGASGMLGHQLVLRLREQGREVDAPSRATLDLERIASLADAIQQRRPSIIVNASAYTDVAAAEDSAHRPAVHALNRDAVREIGRAAEMLDVPLAHVSTDYVFDGRLRRPYRETDPVAPLQVYGRSKWEGEQALAEVCPAAIIVRTSTLYGPGKRERPHFVDAILAQARRGIDLAVVRPPISSPTYAPDLAQAILDLLEREATGIVHVCNDGACSRFELATEAVRYAGLIDTIRIDLRPDPVGGMARPAYSVMDTGRFQEWTGRPMRDWRAALQEYVESTSSKLEAKG